MSNKKKLSKWEINENKAKAMTVKFIAALKKLECFTDWDAVLLEGIVNEQVAEGKSNEAIESVLQWNFGLTVFKSDSMATDIKIEEFLSTLKENPYQLKLIA